MAVHSRVSMRRLLSSSSATTPSGSRRSATELGRVDVLVSPVRVGEVTRAPGVLGGLHHQPKGTQARRG